MFTVHPNGTRGVNVISSTLEAAEKAVTMFKHKQKTSYLTPNKLKRWFESWATITFFPERVFSVVHNVKLSDEYNGNTNIALHFDITCDVANTVLHFTNTIILELQRRDSTPDEIDTDKQAYKQQWIDANIPPEIINNLKLRPTNNNAKTRAEFMKSAEDLLVTFKECSHCNQPASKKCATCKLIRYCSSECQKADWSSHKKLCGAFKFAGENLEKRSRGL